MSEGRSSVLDMIIDCGTCEVAGLACTDCVVTVLLGPPGAVGLADDARPDTWPEVEVADEHTAAIAVLAQSGLIPPLRLVSRRAG